MGSIPRCLLGPSGPHRQRDVSDITKNEADFLTDLFASHLPSGKHGILVNHGFSCVRVNWNLFKLSMVIYWYYFQYCIPYNPEQSCLANPQRSQIQRDNFQHSKAKREEIVASNAMSPFLLINHAGMQRISDILNRWTNEIDRSAVDYLLLKESQDPIMWERIWRGHQMRRSHISL